MSITLTETVGEGTGMEAWATGGCGRQGEDGGGGGSVTKGAQISPVLVSMEHTLCTFEKPISMLNVLGENMLWPMCSSRCSTEA